MEKFGKYLAQYEMAQMDAFKAATFKLSEMIDNSVENKIEFKKTRVIKLNADADCEDVTTTLLSVTKVDNVIVFMDENDETINLEDISMNDVIEITANIVLKIDY